MKTIEEQVENIQEECNFQLTKWQLRVIREHLCSIQSNRNEAKAV